MFVRVLVHTQKLFGDVGTPVSFSPGQTLIEEGKVRQLCLFHALVPCTSVCIYAAFIHGFQSIAYCITYRRAGIRQRNFHPQGYGYHTQGGEGGGKAIQGRPYRRGKA